MEADPDVGGGATPAGTVEREIASRSEPPLPVTHGSPSPRWQSGSARASGQPLVESAYLL